MRTRSLTGPTVALHALRVLLLAAVFVVLLFSVEGLRSDVRRTHTATDFALGTLALERSVLSLQSSASGYALTGRRSYLGSFRHASAQLPTELSRLVASARVSSEGISVQGITAAIDRYEEAVARPVLAHLPPSRRRLVGLLAEGAPTLAALRSSLDRVELGALAQRSLHVRATNRAVELAVILSAIGLGLFLALDLGIATFLLRGLLTPIRRVASTAATFAGGNLGARVPEQGLGEVALLATSFNTMARAIEARSEELSATQERVERALAMTEEASAMKSNFVANMSHEIRTPLNGLMGMLTLLSETKLDQEQRNYLEVALSSSEALLHVVGDVLDIAKIEAGRMELEAIDFDLHEAVESVCELMAAAARAKRLELQSFVHDDVPRAVRGDRTRVCQVLQNLVSNAVKFTHAGEVVVEVTRLAAGDHDIHVRFEVRDSGIGIEPQRVAELFEPFTQAELGTTRKFGGTGLGLAISRELTQLMHGTISGESSVGRGSIFSFEIPLEPSSARVREPLATDRLEGVRVLVVDDSATNRRVLQAYVTRWGMRPVAVAAGHDALVALRDAVRSVDPFLVALLDVTLEGESGFDLARQISSSQQLHATRILMLSSGAGAGVEDRELRVAGRISKPVRQARLLEAITRALGEEGSPEHEGRETQTEKPAALAAGSTRGDSIRASGGGARVLIAEDHDVNWMLIERLLTARGHQVVRARDGQEALGQIGRSSFDLVLMDCQMPKLDGYDTASEIRRRGVRSPGGGSIPIVAMTASALDKTHDRCKRAGMDDYLGKPIDPAALDRALRRWLASAYGGGQGDVGAEGNGGPAGAPAAAVLDVSQIEQLQAIFPGAKLNDAIEEMSCKMRTDLEELTIGVHDEDAKRVASAAHRIRNTAHAVGAHELAAVAGKLDRPPRPDRPAITLDERLAQEVRDRWNEVHEALQRLLRERSG